MWQSLRSDGRQQADLQLRPGALDIFFRKGIHERGERHNVLLIYFHDSGCPGGDDKVRMKS